MSWQEAEDWAAANAIGADNSFGGERNAYTVPTDAIQSMAPVTNSDNGNSWGDLFQNGLKLGISYYFQKDAAKTQASLQQQQQAAPIVVQQQAQNNSLVTLAIIGAVVLVAVKAVN